VLDERNLTADDLQIVDNVLADTGAPSSTRRGLLTKAAAGAAAVGVAGALSPVEAFAAGDSIKTVGVTAVTAEALAVTFLSEIVNRAAGSAVEGAAPVVRAANREEYIHYQTLRKLGFKPLTKKFWIPDAFFADNLSNIPAIIETAETLFVNAYLIGITTFARKGQPTFARYAGEILGVEAEHRALARSLQNKLPNNVAFENYRYHRLSQIVGALGKAGIGFGEKGAAPGAFYEFKTPTAAQASTVQGTKPR
jgi:hypothetical protein